jgi:hypothetical protein
VIWITVIVRHGHFPVPQMELSALLSVLDGYRDERRRADCGDPSASDHSRSSITTIRPVIPRAVSWYTYVPGTGNLRTAAPNGRTVGSRGFQTPPTAICPALLQSVMFFQLLSVHRFPPAGPEILPNARADAVMFGKSVSLNVTLTSTIDTGSHHSPPIALQSSTLKSLGSVAAAILAPRNVQTTDAPAAT